MYKSSPNSAKGGVGFSELLTVSASAGSTASSGIDAAIRKRFASTTHPRKWLRINEAGKLDYITVRLHHSDHFCPCFPISLVVAIPTCLFSS